MTMYRVKITVFYLEVSSVAEAPLLLSPYRGEGTSSRGKIEAFFLNKKLLNRANPELTLSQ